MPPDKQTVLDLESLAGEEVKQAPMTICVDFDGTIVDHRFPDIGREVPGAIQTLKDLKAAGHKLILFTMRCDGRDHPYLGDAIEWCRERGVEFDGHNCNRDQASWTTSPKCYGHVYIDDAALGCPLRENPRAGGRPVVDWDRARDELMAKGLL